MEGGGEKEGGRNYGSWNDNTGKMIRKKDGRESGKGEREEVDTWKQ